MIYKLLKYECKRLQSKNRHSAFTLIELLVVISIISMLSSIVLAAMSTARQNAKNAKFVEELNSVKNAMALYYSDHQAYPYTPASPNGALISNVSSPSFSTVLGGALLPYLSSLPDGLSTANNSLVFYGYGTSLSTSDTNPGGFHCGSASAPIVSSYIIYFNYSFAGGTLNANKVYRNIGYGVVAQPYYCIGE